MIHFDMNAHTFGAVIIKVNCGRKTALNSCSDQTQYFPLISSILPGVLHCIFEFLYGSVTLLLLIICHRCADFSHNVTRKQNSYLIKCVICSQALVSLADMCLTITMSSLWCPDILVLQVPTFSNQLLISARHLRLWFVMVSLGVSYLFKIPASFVP